ncbi:hypothetical protein HZF08_33730 [Paenibacillus sp. CGMCC 1.16610]|uniref:Uncharacterized protein n=1 Tax=Paenibacillus anseongense TaxID=2682845 RepID=A0ABW9U0V2_9BACL|nr:MULTISPECIES: CBO0543 family protein [Paenibacillus]MBA2943234.1 hypothetical protein [Paenibacillus sp. CGMCC 1.16610]MVQ33732.1 hypothetical protein [Paenibacillus anseongense]
MEKKQIIELIDANVNQIQTLIHERVEIWQTYVLFSGLWWFGLFLSIFPWIVWIFLRDKHSTDRILYAGYFVMVISLILDILGDQLGFWHYRFNVIPVLPTYFPWDITLMPVSVMFLIQIKPKTNPYLKAIFFALLTSYVAEPFFTWLKIYEPQIWKFSYSAPIQFIIYLLAHYFSRRNKFKELT